MGVLAIYIYSLEYGEGDVVALYDCHLGVIRLSTELNTKKLTQMMSTTRVAGQNLFCFVRNFLHAHLTTREAHHLHT